MSSKLTSFPNAFPRVFLIELYIPPTVFYNPLTFYPTVFFNVLKFFPVSLVSD